MLKDHLSIVFAEEPELFKLLFEGEKGESLYELRHKIAHGGLDLLSDLERQTIASRIWDIERTARKYFQNVVRMATGKMPFTYRMIKSMHVPFMIASHKDMYVGSTHMAEFYTYVER
jgi:hypothetical protein